MTGAGPTPEEASRAVVEARLRASQVHKADTQLGWMLAILAGAVLGIGGLMSLAPHVVGPAVLVTYVAAIVLVIVVFARIRAYSRGGLILFSFSASGFTIWNSLVAGLSVVTGWWGPSQAAYHLGVSAAIGVVPLLVGVWLLARRRS